MRMRNGVVPRRPQVRESGGLLARLRALFQGRGRYHSLKNKAKERVKKRVEARKRELQAKMKAAEVLRRHSKIVQHH